jgi:polar amino acid transport system substrate-binding protein
MMCMEDKLIIGILIVFLLSLYITKRYIKQLKINLFKVDQDLASERENMRKQYGELMKNQSELRTSEERYRIAVETANDGLWDWDVHKNVCFISEKWQERLSLPSNLIENHFEVWLGKMHPDDEVKVRQLVKNYLEGKVDQYHVEYRLRDECGNYIWIQSKSKMIKDKTGNIIRMVGAHTDITERKEYEEKIYKMAYFDGLTNLPNRSFLIEKLDAAIKNAVEWNQKGALFFLDLDNFKQINDTLGHDVGDQLLKAVGKKINEYLGSDFITARLGGDEFVILKEVKASSDEVEKTAEKIINLFTDKWKLGNNEMVVTISMGSTIFPDDGMDVQKILKNADTAMYCAKDAGKNINKFFKEDMLENILARKELETDLRKAIEKHEFQLFYQPYFRAHTREISGIEALIRWAHPKKGLIAPAEFIPLAEETGLIREIGEWVITEACKKNKEWQQKGYKKVPIAVNISTVQLGKNSPQMIENILSDSDLPPEWLEFEITESKIMELIEENIDILKKLKEIGVRISIDDFGTGYSSLSYLRQLPLDVIKIDKSFISDIKSSNQEMIITSDIISIAHKLNLQVIAEGVEGQHQMDYLINQKCDFQQGFFFSKPLNFQEMEDLFKKSSAKKY